MTVDELFQSATTDSAPPQDVSDLQRSLWLTKAGHWEDAHQIAQDIDTPMGSWVHALLHLIEGDTGNAGYWFRKAGKPSRTVGEIDELWMEIASDVCA